jgi:glycosyltransferase involved in cell wall biosynthesis
MRIAMLHWAFPPVIGGVESHLATLCPALVARGDEVSLLTGSVDGRRGHGIWSGVAVARTPLMDLNHLRGQEVGGSGSVLRREIAHFLDVAGPDVVHAHNMHYFSPAHLDALSGWCQDAAVPLVLTAHNVWEDDLWRRMCYRSPAWDRTIAVSRYIADELARAGFPRERLEVVHHGLDTDRFQPQEGRVRRSIQGRYPELAGRRVIFHPARSSVAKGSLVAVAALATIRSCAPDALLVCAGAGAIVDWGNVQGAELEEIRQAVRRDALEDHVLIRSFAWEEMADLYQIAAVTVYPSLHDEPFGLGVLEAMASGSPVVVSRSGGMPEFVDDTRTGYVVPPGDAQSLAECCIELLSRPQRASELSGHARQAVLARHTVGHMTELTSRVYASALAGGRSEPSRYGSVAVPTVLRRARDAVRVHGESPA